ncbi:hypothetical protein X557_01555 [Francisella tularensis subsp. holarctica PHIT-FT049]|uniref:hypothetical protein n=1 Tax=Francisella tularensis TaxID=263 RepID=UPI0003E76465|nr:hypothetical protein X557_01555 [Francisella tularensis subsp. holarctica PHIT-FT049]
MHKLTVCDLVYPTGFFWSTIFIEGYFNFNELRSGKGLLAKLYKHRTFEKVFSFLAISLLKIFCAKISICVSRPEYDAKVFSAPDAPEIRGFTSIKTGLFSAVRKISV